MNCLVTGATGFIGRQLVEALLARGDCVHYLARQPAHLPVEGALFHEWRGGKPNLAELPPLEAVFNLAGEPIAQRWTPEVKKQIRESRISGTRNLVSALWDLAEKPAVLVSASAVGYYGDRQDEILSEASAPGADFLAGVCVDWEREASAAGAAGIRVAHIRIATVLGREGGALKQMLPLFRLGLGGKFGSGQQWVSWIGERDLVRLLLFAAGDPSAVGPLNAASPQPVRNAEFTQVLARALHRPAAFAAPRFALKLALGEMSDFLFASLRVVPERTRSLGFVFEHPSLEGALISLLS